MVIWLAKQYLFMLKNFKAILIDFTSFSLKILKNYIDEY